MNPSSRSAILFSAVLHGLLLGVVALFAWRGATHRADANNLLVMEIVAPPGEAEENSFTAPPADAPFAEPAAREDAAPDAPEQPLLRQPEIAPLAEQSFEELKDVPPVPEPEPEPEPEPVAPPPQPKPAPDRTQPAPKTPPAPAQPKLMTRDQFLETSGLPKQARSTPRQTTATTPATRGTGGTGRAPVRIDTGGSAQALAALLGSGSSARVAQMSASDQNALRTYLSQLRTNIRRAWILPDSVSEKGESAEVFVTIEPNGRISNVRIGKHNGSKAFLDSITEAVRRARSAGPTPSGQREFARYELNLRDM